MPPGQRGDKNNARNATIISKLNQHESDLRRVGVRHLYLFGSAARGDDSDVDLIFDHENGKIGLFQFMGLSDFTASVLGQEVDIMTRDSLHPLLRQDIEATTIRVF